MNQLLVPALLTCGPWLLSSGALAETFVRCRKGMAQSSAVWLVGGAWLVSAFAAYVFLRYTLFPLPGSPPPWKDPETLDLALLFFLAPVGVGFTIAAKFKSASSWAMIALLISMAFLLGVGLLEGISV